MLAQPAVRRFHFDPEPTGLRVHDPQVWEPGALARRAALAQGIHRTVERLKQGADPVGHIGFAGHASHSWQVRMVDARAPVELPNRRRQTALSVTGARPAAAVRVPRPLELGEIAQLALARRHDRPPAQQLEAVKARIERIGREPPHAASCETRGGHQDLRPEPVARPVVRRITYHAVKALTAKWWEECIPHHVRCRRAVGINSHSKRRMPAKEMQHRAASCGPFNEHRDFLRKRPSPPIVTADNRTLERDLNEVLPTHGHVLVSQPCACHSAHGFAAITVGSKPTRA